MIATSPAQGPVDRMVAEGDLAGAVGLVWRDGRLASQFVSGFLDIETRLPMRRDAIFRIASLTKPITSVAALMLHEQGRFDLEEPITRWAPEFQNMQVLCAPDGPLDDVVPAQRPISFEDLLTHRSGLTHGGFHSGPLRGAYRDAIGVDFDSEHHPDAWIGRLARLPLVDQPGRMFHYGLSSDLLGLVVARMEGAPLAEVLQRRIFGPLGMQDTGFDVPPDRRSRIARMYGFDLTGRLDRRDAHPVEEPAFLAVRPVGTEFVSGGAGLWSTADDYLTFARLFIEEGAVGGVRLLKADTVRRMTSNVLNVEQISGAKLLGRPVFSGHGFGLGVAVVLDPEKAAVNPCKGGAGAVGWPGAYGGWWQADPTDGSVLVFLAQNALDFDRVGRGFGLGVFAAIETFHAAEAHKILSRAASG
jgi:CubicO group peptidase (beta-lactamase class C family)